MWRATSAEAPYRLPARRAAAWFRTRPVPKQPGRAVRPDRAAPKRRDPRAPTRLHERERAGGLA